MSEYDLLKGLSELDEDLIMQPRKPVSLRMNLLLCVIAANISALFRGKRPVWSIVAFVVSFGVMYAFATWFVNRKGKRGLLIDPQREDDGLPED